MLMNQFDDAIVEEPLLEGGHHNDGTDRTARGSGQGMKGMHCGNTGNPSDGKLWEWKSHGRTSK
jgi:hypothetical protein